ncbi:MAG: hypothetical protein Q9225_005400 [Loekoesia sp. 1 TL-2023]
MACERRVWRYDSCEHEEELDLRCSLSADPDHIHNTVVVETETPPRCSICNPPALIDENLARDLVRAATDRHLPAPRSTQSIFRGADAEVLVEEQTTSGTDISSPGQNGTAAGGATVNGASMHVSYRSFNTYRNVPPTGNDPNAVSQYSGSPAQEEQDDESSQRETDSNTVQQ